MVTAAWQKKAEVGICIDNDWFINQKFCGITYLALYSRC